jgi:hypothetical protein
MARDIPAVEEPDDDEALSWGTERDTTHIEAPVEELEPDAEELDEPQSVDPAGNSMLLVIYGIFAGVFLLYAVGWIIAIQRISVADAGPLALILDRFAQFLAFLSPVIWFFGVLLLVPNTRARARILWLLLGVVTLAPWPFILGY